MISKEEQDTIVKKITAALSDHDLGIIILRPSDGALVLYINDPKSAVNDAYKFNDKSGGN